MLVGRLEQLAQVMEDKFKWREWKYLFKLGSSKVAWAVNKLCNYRMTLQSPIKQMIDMVNKEEFTASINTLGLIADPKYTNGATEEVKDKKPSKKDSHNKARYVHLSSVESLCVPPNAKNSVMAKRALELLKKKEKTDLVFEIVLVHDQGDIVIDHTHGEPIERSESERDVDVYEIPAHCVILASRCNWFSRALQSGMRESIDKKIAIHDTNPEVFSLFLEYLYSGQLKLETFSTEQLTDLLALGDRYEDRSLNYVVKNPSVTEGEMFSELPDHLKAEVENAMAAGGCDSESSAEFQVVNNSSNQTYQDVVKTINNVSISEESTSSSSSSTELLQMIEDPDLLQSCVTSLREVVGNEASDDELIHIIMSADYDINRAINFYYSLVL
ncbi:hypothetical protein KUTeg_004478 [Tegillarca granosa]|uniref:BTB domain-containing protein n=1 Tax=Tegillarca granosa TaxID=220873 RepID=A0ABQ9FQ21_TEGGR|nr:hypothetical protein KUTeg_004478 [Tegillarca granosa]